MSHISTGVEYGLHCLLYLVDPAVNATGASVRDLADLQGVPAEYMAKLFTKLQKAGIVVATEGKGGGFRLAKPAAKISVLDVITAVDGEKPLFDCREIRGRCAVFRKDPPNWSTRGVCSIHAVMLEAEKHMRDTLATHTLASISNRVAAKAPAGFNADILAWLDSRAPRKRSKSAGERT